MKLQLTVTFFIYSSLLLTTQTYNTLHIQISSIPFIHITYDLTRWRMNLHFLKTARATTSLTSQRTNKADHFTLIIINHLDIKWSQRTTALTGTKVSIYIGELHHNKPSKIAFKVRHQKKKFSNLAVATPTTHVHEI